MPKLRQANWTCEGVVDAYRTDYEARCEVCNKPLRWIHILTRRNFPLKIEAGCCCAARLCSGYDAVSAERTAKNRADRLQRFLNPDRWRRSAKGNPTRKGRDYLLTIYQNSQGQWRFCVKRKREKDPVHPFCFFLSEDEAIRAAFEWLEKFGRSPDE